MTRVQGDHHLNEPLCRLPEVCGDVSFIFSSPFWVQGSEVQGFPFSFIFTQNL